MTLILLVEDNDMNRDMISRRLERHGYTIIFAVNGEESIEITRNKQPDLILMDMSLPVMDGWEATRQIKADPSIAHIPVIGLSAHTMAGDREKAIAAGCDDYDIKPIDLPRLLDKISSYSKQENNKKHSI